MRTQTDRQMYLVTVTMRLRIQLVIQREHFAIISQNKGIEVLALYNICRVTQSLYSYSHTIYYSICISQSVQNKGT